MAYSDLEYLVMEDMANNGYDHNNPEDVRKYWSERLD